MSKSQASRFLRWSMLLLMALFSFQCIDLKDPVMPHTDVNASVPLFDKSYDLQNVNSPLLKVLSTDNSFYIDTTVVNKTLQLDTLKVDPTRADTSVTVGQFTIDGIPAPPPITLSLPAATVPKLPLPAPQTVPDKDTTFPSGLNIDITAHCDFVVIDTGGISLSITNTSPFQMQFPDGIRIRNDVTGDTTTLAHFKPGLLDTVGGSGSNTYYEMISLAGQTVQGHLKMDNIRVIMKGRPTGFSVSAGQGMTIQFGSTKKFKTSAAQAKIPEQMLADRDVPQFFQVDGTTSIESALFRRGNVVFRFQNATGITVRAFLRFEDVVTMTTPSTPYQLDSTLVPNTTLNAPVDMGKYKVQIAAPQIYGTKLHFHIGVTSIKSDQKSLVRATDFVAASVIPVESFVLKEITGRIKPTTMLINTGAHGISSGDVSKVSVTSMKYYGAKITLKLHLTGGFVTDYNLRLIARNFAKNVTDTLIVPPPQGLIRRQFTPGTPIALVLDSTNGLGDFLSKFFPAAPPDTFILRGSITMNPSDIFPTAEGKKTITDTAKMYSSVSTYFPLKIGINNASLIDTASIAGEFDKDLAMDTRNAAVNVKLTNGLPLGVTFIAYLLGPEDANTHKRDTVLTLPTDGQLLINAASVGSDGYVTAPQSTYRRFGLTGDQALKLSKAEKVIYRISLHTSDGLQTVPPGVFIRKTDFVRVESSATISYIVNNPR